MAYNFYSPTQGIEGNDLASTGARTLDPTVRANMIRGLLQRNHQYMAEAAAMGLTGQAAAQYASQKQQEWGEANGIHGDALDFFAHAAPGVALAGLGGMYAAGAMGAGAAGAEAGAAGLEGAGAAEGGAAAGAGAGAAGSSPMLLADAGTTMTDVGGGMGAIEGGAAAGTAGAGAEGAGSLMPAAVAEPGGAAAVEAGAAGTSGAASGDGLLSSLASGGTAALDFLNANKGILGPLAGGILGGMSGSKPAGTTTTVQDVPEWLKPYVMGNMNAATSVRDSLTTGPNVVNAAVPGYLKTINGDYLSPGSNPYLDATYKHAAGLVGAGVDSRFESAGRYGSGAHQGVLEEGLNNLATSIYGGNYQTERARQDAAITGAPQFATNQATAGYAPYTGYASLFPNVKSTTAPYFQNQGAGILGGALAGGALSRMMS